MMPMKNYIVNQLTWYLYCNLSSFKLVGKQKSKRIECCYRFFTVSGASFYPAPACQMSKRTGNLSTLCITNPSSSMDKSSQGIFLISVDPCSIPISYWAVALFPAKNNTQIIKQYTASKTDLFVPVGGYYFLNIICSNYSLAIFVYGCD